MGQLEGKTAVITGAASGIGAGTARRFVQEGARVLITDIQDEVGEALAAELGESARYRHCDVIHESEVQGAIDEAVGAWGRLDALFNNAGFVGVSGPVESISSDDYDVTMNVLLRSVFYGIKHAAPVMKSQGSGSILNTASVCGFRAGIGTHVYSVAKAGVISLTESVALELAEFGVRVNAICPGYVATQLAAGRALSDLDEEEARERLTRARDLIGDSQPIARMGEPADVASLAVFLASDDSQWITGTAQVIDGGLTVGKPWRKQVPQLTENRPIRMYNPADR